MAYEIVKNGSVEYAVDWEVLTRLVNANARARMLLLYSSAETTSDASFFNPFSWSSPDVRSAVVDWDAVRSNAGVETFGRIYRMRLRGDTDMPSVGREMLDLVSETRRCSKQFLDWQASLQSENMERIQAAVSSYETQIGVAKFFRDTSAEGLMVGATVLSGGAAAVALGGGSALKGVGRWEDSGSVSAGVITGVGSLTLGVFKMQGMGSGALAVLQSVQETGTCLVEGKSVAESVATGSLKLAGPAVDKVAKLPFMQTLLKKAAVPLAIGMGDATGAFKFTEGFVKSLIKKQLVERGGKAGIKAVLGNASGQAASIERPIDTALLHDELLVKASIVNMQEGIARGW